jgi:hypothetical protein
MTISKRLQLKLFMLVFSSFAGLSVVPMMALSPGPMVTAPEKRKEYQSDIKHVLTSGQPAIDAASPLAVFVNSEIAAVEPRLFLQPKMVSKNMPVLALAEGARYWEGEQRREAM